MHHSRLNAPALPSPQGASNSTSTGYSADSNNQPDDYLYAAPAAGLHYGYPWCHWCALFRAVTITVPHLWVYWPNHVGPKQSSNTACTPASLASSPSQGLILRPSTSAHLLLPRLCRVGAGKPELRDLGPGYAVADSTLVRALPLPLLATCRLWQLCCSPEQGLLACWTTV